MDIRRIRADEGLQLRAIRLRALTDAPDAFGDTLAAATSRPTAASDERAARAAIGESSVLFVAEERGRWFGLVGGVVDDETPPGEAELVSLWVDPVARRRGVARRLVAAVLTWARARGAARLRLWVTEGNTPAIALYQRYGFTFTGEAATLPSNPALRELLMLCQVPPATERGRCAARAAVL